MMKSNRIIVGNFTWQSHDIKHLSNVKYRDYIDMTVFTVKMWTDENWQFS